MVSGLVLVSSPGWDNTLCSCAKHSHGASLHPGVKSSEITAGGLSCNGLVFHPGGGGVEIILVASC